MAKRGRKGSPLSEPQKKYIEMTVDGASEADIWKTIFNEDLATIDKRTKHTIQCRLWRWAQHPEYEKYERQCYRKRWGKMTYKAMGVMEEGMTDETLPWRRTQSAVAVLNQGQKIIAGEEAGVIKVQVIGLPELGIPDEDDGESGED